MRRTMFCAVLLSAALCPPVFAQPASTPWHLRYSPSHRARFEQEWKYNFPNHHSTHWIIALRYPPSLAWSRDVECQAELLTSQGWKPFKQVVESSREKRRMLVIDYPHDDPKLRHGFTIRTSLTATLYGQHLERGRPVRPVAPLANAEWENFLAATPTYDFDKPAVKQWMDRNRMWRGKDEPAAAFALRVYRKLRHDLPYSTKDGGEWICSQILKAGYGECCRHAIVGTSLLRANGIPARTVCGLWAVDNKSTGAHCWGEFFWEGVGWVPYDTTYNADDRNTVAYFGNHEAGVLAGMMDFDWVIHAGPFGNQTVFAIDAWPAYWSEGPGSMDNPKVQTTTHVHVVQRSR